MCVTVRVRHACQHLGRIQGFESCHWFDTNEKLLEIGVGETDSRFVANNEHCRRDASYTYHNTNTLCGTCWEQEMQKGEGRAMKTLIEHEIGRSEETDSGARIWEDEYDDKRDTASDLFPRPHPLYDAEKKVKFSVGPPSSKSSTSSVEDPSSRPSSTVKNKQAKALSDDGLLLYQPSEPRFDYPIGDLIMKDMSKFEKYFKIKPPNSDNWIFSSECGVRCIEFARFQNALNPAFNAKHLGDMYPNDIVKTHLMKYLRKENHWKASAFSLHRFAFTAKGHVHVLLPRDCTDPLQPYPDGANGPVDCHWELYQVWALTKFDRVRGITRYNADDFSKVGIIWQTGQPILGEPPDFWIGPRPVERNSEIDQALYSSALMDSQ